MRLSLPGGAHEVEVDVEATGVCYARIVKPAPEACECAYCANWVAGRSSVINDDVARFLAQFGIPTKGEIEVWQTTGFVKANLYGGWYKFVGQHVVGDPRQAFRVGELEFSFGGSSYPIEAFADQQSCELHFLCEIDDHLSAEQFDAVTRRNAERLAQSRHADGPARLDMARTRLRAAFSRVAS
jgi:hypothetical protein